MKRRWSTIGILLFLLIFTIVQIPGVTPSQPIILTPSDDIQSIIDTVAPFTTIILSKGTYQQSFTISKEITLKGEHPTTTIIEATTEKNKPAITIASPSVFISNMTIINHGPGLYTTGIRVISDETTISYCSFQYTPIGISIWSNTNTIQHCTFTNCSDEGIVLLSTSFSTANNNTIRHCNFEKNCDAIELQQSCDNLIEHCIMTYNTHSGIDAIDKNNNRNKIENCTIEHNAVHGIYFSYSKDNTIINCLLQNNTDGDIITPNSTNTTVIKEVHKNQHSIETKAQHNENFVESLPPESKENREQYPYLQKIITKLQSLLQFFI